MPPRLDLTDPRRPEEKVPFKFTPVSSTIQFSDYGAVGAMVFAGATMVTRYPMWAWFALFCAASSVLSTRSTLSSPTARKEGMFSGSSCVLFCFTALFSVYSPILLGQATKEGGKPFSFGKGLVPIVNPMM
ncbi:hypothetical protein RQP46_006882 [Phenoliferia psychrophenolica]